MGFDACDRILAQVTPSDKLSSQVFININALSTLGH
jgi:hypothetical protein